MATTVFAALFVHRHDGDDPPPSPPSGGGPALKVLNGGLATLALAVMVAGCSSSYQELETAIAGGDVSGALAKCRDEARTAYYVDKKSKDDALAIYEACKVREGVQ
jgi:hypothetical protein